MKRFLALAVLFGVLLLGVVSGVGKWLVVEGPLRPAVAIAILGGKMPFRAMEAAAIYRAGYAQQVWLPGPEVAAEHEPIHRMGFSPDDPQLYIKVLEHLGVPRHAVRVLSPGAKNTRQEIAVISKALRNAGGGRVIIVTSPWHTRRARAIWTRTAWPLDELTVRYTRHEPREVQLDRWWEDAGDRAIVFRELGGLVDVWLGGPMVLVGR